MKDDWVDSVDVCVLVHIKKEICRNYVNQITWSSLCILERVRGLISNWKYSISKQLKMYKTNETLLLEIIDFVRIFEKPDILVYQLLLNNSKIFVFYNFPYHIYLFQYVVYVFNRCLSSHSFEAHDKRKRLLIK